MLKKLAFVVAAASLFAFAPSLARFGPVVSSVALVWMAVLTAVVASGSVSSIAVGSGAFGALGAGILAPVSPSAAGAILVLAAFGERTTRVRSRTARAVHVGLAVVGGAFAGSLSAAFEASSLPVVGVAVVVSAIIAALPLLVLADDPTAHALANAAEALPEPTRAALLEGAELRRATVDLPLDGVTGARVRTTWHSLLKLAEARLRLERSRPKGLENLSIRVAAESEPAAALARPTAASAVRAMIDQRIAEHVAVLCKTLAAVDTVSAASLGLDDAALKNIDSLGESLEEESRALVEVKSAST